MLSFNLIIFMIGIETLSNALSQNCTDISEETKSNMLSEFERFYRRYTMELIKSRVKSSDPKREDPSQYRDKSICEEDKNKNNNSLIYKRSLCPWYTKIMIREDRYPPFAKEVRCACESCNTKNFKLNPKSPNGTYYCLPVMSPSVGLKRGICGRNGIYEWTPTIENFNVACVCALQI